MEAGLGLVDLIRKLVDPKPAVDPETFRKARPSRNTYVEAEATEDGGLLLRAPLSTQGRGFMGNMAKKAGKPDVKQFELEVVGAFVWSMCDGQQSFDSISKQLRVKYKMSRMEADASLAAFLQMLTQRRLISLTIPQKKK
jgi:hypothetical protein